MHPTSLAALSTFGRKTFNRLVVHVDSSIVTYSLDILARLALDKSQLQSLDASIERIGGNDVNIVLCRYIHPMCSSSLNKVIEFNQIQAIDKSELAKG
jgi:RHO1 GDP-GTP exchange protein 1/2